jgi:MSHA pilin protein MshD
MCIERHQRGLTLIELIVFIVIVGVALAGVLTVLDHTVRHSADPMIRKQALAIAEAMMEEALAQPFTWCDPDDAVAETAAGTGGCTVPEVIGVETVAGSTDTRPSNTSPFDNVSDYHNLSTTTNIAGGGTAVYTASVAVEEVALNGIAASDALRITVTVTAPGETIELQGYRTRHSPNLLP